MSCAAGAPHRPPAPGSIVVPPPRDFYDVLGVGRDADAQRIRKAYRRLARKHHPDLNPDDQAAAARFREIGEAYEVLSDPARRRRYDALGAAGRRRAGPFPSEGGWSSFANGGSPFPRTAGGHDLSGVFSRIFGNGGPFRPGAANGPSRWDSAGWTPARGSGGAPGATAPETPVEIRLEEVLSGAVRTLRSASGASFRVRIPAGVTDGTRLRVPTGDGPATIRVRVADHPRFRRRGDDLEVEVPVSFGEAALGGEIEVPTLEGPVRVRLPAGTAGRSGLRLRGRGLPRTGSAPVGAGNPERGDLVAQIRVVVPEHLTPEQRDAARRFSGSTKPPRD